MKVYLRTNRLHYVSFYPNGQPCFTLQAVRSYDPEEAFEIAKKEGRMAHDYFVIKNNLYFTGLTPLLINGTSYTSDDAKAGMFNLVQAMNLELQGYGERKLIYGYYDMSEVKENLFYVKKENLYLTERNSGEVLWAQGVKDAAKLPKGAAEKIANTWGARLIEHLEDYQSAYVDAKARLDKIEQFINMPLSENVAWDIQSEILRILKTPL
jgi:hypothetical protein